MKFRKLQFNQNKILGNLELDFINPNSNLPYETIILVGENGVGKTTILTEISDFLNGDDCSLHFDNIEYCIEPNNQIVKIKSIPESPDVFSFIRVKNDKEERLQYGWDQSHNNGYQIDNMNNDLEDPRHYSSLISMPRSAFNTRQINSIGVSELDTTDHEKDSENDFTSLKQLLVDLSSLDSEEFTELHRRGNPISISEFEQSSRMSRFTKAFNNFFDAMTYSCIKGV